MSKPGLSAWRRVTVVVLSVGLSVGCASPPRFPALPVAALQPGDDPWNVVTGLAAGQLVLAGLAPGSAAANTHGAEVKATLVGADPNGLDLRTVRDDSGEGTGGVAVTLSREEVQYLKVPASQDRPRRGGWLGFAIGFGAGAAMGLRGATEPGSFWPLVVPLAGAGLGFIGFLIGRGVDRNRTRGDFITVYPIAGSPGSDDQR